MTAEQKTGMDSNVPEVVETLLREKRWSGRKLAEESGLSEAAIRKIRGGQGNVEVRTLRMLGRAFGSDLLLRVGQDQARVRVTRDGEFDYDSYLDELMYLATDGRAILVPIVHNATELLIRHCDEGFFDDERAKHLKARALVVRGAAYSEQPELYDSAMHALDEAMPIAKTIGDWETAGHAGWRRVEIKRKQADLRRPSGPDVAEPLDEDALRASEWILESPFVPSTHKRATHQSRRKVWLGRRDDSRFSSEWTEAQKLPIDIDQQAESPFLPASVRIMELDVESRGLALFKGSIQDIRLLADEARKDALRKGLTDQVNLILLEYPVAIRLLESRNHEERALGLVIWYECFKACIDRGWSWLEKRGARIMNELMRGPRFINELPQVLPISCPSCLRRTVRREQIVRKKLTYVCNRDYCSFIYLDLERPGSSFMGRQSSSFMADNLRWQ